jgi:hypothetical protein
VGSPYRTSTLEPVSRKATGWGTGERFTLRVPMPEGAVLAAFERLTQTDRPTRHQRKTGSHRPFWGRVAAPGFELVPLRFKESALRVRVDLEPHEDVTVLDVEIALPSQAIVALVALGILGLAAACIVHKPSLGDFVYVIVRVLLQLVFAAAVGVAGVRVGIGDVRRRILEAVRESNEPTQPAEPIRAALDWPRLLENPERTVERLDAWLRERLR